MAIPILNHMDFQKVAEIQNVLLHSTSTAAVTSPGTGQVIFDSGTVKYYNGSTWISLASGSGGEENQNAFSNIAVSGQTTVAADAKTDTVTFIAGSNVTITTNAANDEITFASTDTNTTYTGGTGLTLSGTTFNTNVNATTQTVAANTVSATASRTYALQVDASDNLVVNVPWSDSNTDVDVSVANLRTRLGQISDNTTIGDASDVTISFAGGVTVTGDLTVNGTTTTVNSNTVNIGDAIITLNSDETGAPSQNAGIEIERGTSANKTLIWDETADKWTVGTDTFVAGTFEGSAALTGTPTAPSAAASTDSTQIATTAFTQDAIDARTYVASVGGATSIAVTHNLGTRDVIVQLYDNTTFDTVFADVERNSTSQVTLTFASAPSAGGIRVLVSKIV